MSLGEHPRSDEHIDLTVTEITARLIQESPPRGRVAIDARHAQCGKELRQPLFNLFRAFANVVDVLLAARRANLRHGLTMIAVVTDNDALAAMIRKRHIAIRTLDR